MSSHDPRVNKILPLNAAENSFSWAYTCPPRFHPPSYKNKKPGRKTHPQGPVLNSSYYAISLNLSAPFPNPPQTYQPKSPTHVKDMPHQTLNCPSALSTIPFCSKIEHCSRNHLHGGLCYSTDSSDICNIIFLLLSTCSTSALSFFLLLL